MSRPDSDTKESPLDLIEATSTLPIAEAFDSLDLAVLILDARERITFASSRYRRLFDLKERVCHARANYANIVRILSERGMYGQDISDATHDERMAPVRNRQRICRQWRLPDGRLLEETGAPLSSGGYTFSYTEVKAQLAPSVQLKNAKRATVLALADLAEFRDTDTGEHVMRVARLTQEIARSLDNARAFPNEIDQDFRAQVGLASILHDVGKVAIGDDLLRKPGLLDDVERLAMQEHSVAGAAILTKALSLAPDSDYLRIAAEIARYHHERYDGTGYPEGLCRNKIPLSARIVAVADVFDALTSLRSYKRAWSEEEAINYLVKQSGSQFDPQIISATLLVFEERRKTPVIRWSEAMSVGHPVLDRDHLTLIGLVNQMSLPANRGDKTVLEFVLDELLGYAAAHFSREEEHLRRIGFDNIERHEAIHRDLVDELRTIRANFYEGNVNLGDTVAKFVADWLRNHILLEDMNYAI
ncbi:MAG: bacteriohemerythrin [Alphaproteobacteria bacterium]|nr:bacteriohemerythrin [Alphaproteobacteria bacterium]